MSTMVEKNESQSSIMMKAWSHYTQITSRVVGCVLGSIALLSVPSYFLDKAFGTWPIITGIALILSIPLSQLMILKSIKAFLKKNPQ